MSIAKDIATAKYGKFIEVIEEKIATMNASGKNLPATALAKEIGPAFGWEWPTAYQFIRAYIDERDDLKVHGGPKGGIGPKRSE